MLLAPPNLEATLRDQPLLALPVLFAAGVATSLTRCAYTGSGGHQDLLPVLKRVTEAANRRE